MRFFATIALVAGLSARVLAAPVDTPAPISITIFEDVLYTGSAVTLILPYGACRNIPEGFNDVTSSVKLGPTTSICQMFKDINCLGDSVAITPPGAANLAETSLNDAASSFKCWT